MKTTPAAALADFLDMKAAAVHDIEARAEAALTGEDGQQAYEGVMREKATLLADIADDAKPLLEALPASRADDAAERLGMFSMNAKNSLRIGSVFYMSALLYPDDHQKGQPNNLELFAAEVRAWA